jgi:hypothetical protein
MVAGGLLAWHVPHYWADPEAPCNISDVLPVMVECGDLTGGSLIGPFLSYSVYWTVLFLETFKPYLPGLAVQLPWFLTFFLLVRLVIRRLARMRKRV